MKLKDLLQNVDVLNYIGGDKEITGITYNSNNVKPGYLFFCIQGFKIDGHSFAADAIKKGASAIVISKNVGELRDAAIIQVEDTRKAMAQISANYYSRPSDKLQTIGITGTNGKTTTAFMIKSVMDYCRIKNALLGTIYNIIGSKTEEAKRTTPESMDLQEMFKEMVDNNIETCIMEVSSHSLELKRVYDVNFKAGIFTNLTQDHLDFHKTMDNYFKAKLKLFDKCEYAVINIDDNYGGESLKFINNKIITYGIENKCDIMAENLEMSGDGSQFDICFMGEKAHFKINLPGKYNVYNALACIGACTACGISLKDIKSGLNILASVPGRSEKITSNKGFTVIVDYAHTPDGLENVLKAAREYTKNRLITVFGCGGDRDKTKRPIMGKAAGTYSDYCIITSDNPRSEEPDAIIENIIPGINETGCSYTVISDRRSAIEYAIENAQYGDVVVIAGKGHENYQVSKDKTIHFDDKEIVKELLGRD